MSSSTLNDEEPQGNALFGLDLFVVFQWGDLHLRTLQGLQVLHFTFESDFMSETISKRETIYRLKLLFARFLCVIVSRGLY
ncbi:hypothetical protein H663_019800 [Limnohabitans planktonicus II-D5]|uniref:Uncharacterized protein n=1 Tax=Limnohabitans planktonicus II-D5 TaxID=1293045 RepID=A0A2T7U8J7_9BURK|nr:hypothetical protein H663_019800 [Limnohabitans planktonicus II-D5]